MPARRRPPEPPPIEIKQFTPEEIERGIAKLRRRIEEVRAFDPRQVRHDDQRVRNAEQNISTTILEVFGPNSPEFRAHQFQHIWHGSLYVGMPQAEIQHGFAEGISHTITMLEGLIGRLEEKRGELGHDATARVRTDTHVLVINSQPAAFIQQSPELSQAQVSLDAATHPVLKKDSFIDCKEVPTVSTVEVERQLVKDMCRIDGEISPAIRAQVIQKIEASRTITREVKAMLLADFRA